MFSWFSKERRLKDIENKLNLMEKSLFISFTNIKKDVIDTKNISSYRLHEILRRIERLESEVFDIKGIKSNLLSHQERLQQDIPITQDFTTEKNQPHDIGIAGKITEVQQNILTVLAKLHVEDPEKWIAAKQLAEELYPNKNYESIRPMISNYLDVLEELNLTKKLRKRRQVFTKLTSRGISYISPQLKIKPQLKQVPKIKKSSK